jgi:hypothetical protein
MEILLMKKLLLLVIGISVFHFSQATTTAQARAAKLQNGMNLSVWLESGYWYFNTTTFPDVTRFTENDIKNLHDLCFQSVRLPVFFEPFANYNAPYAFDMTNQNVVRGLNYVDSAIAWTAKYNMTLIIDNHLADDDNTYGLQTHYQITDNNYTQQAALLCAVWKQVIARYEYADPDRVLFELRNEPNSVSDANLRTVYQTLIDTVRQYDKTHTLVVGNTGYYDAPALSASTPYTDTNLIYTFHIYDGDGYYGFCFQGLGGENASDSLTGTHISFARHGAQATEITNEVQGVYNWSAAHNNVPVWLSEFGCTTMPTVYGDDTSRCNYFETFADVINTTHIPWAYWEGYGPSEYLTTYDNGATFAYGFSIFDETNTLDAAHMNSCFKSAFAVAGQCTTNGIKDVAGAEIISLYPNPANTILHISCPVGSTIDLYSATGDLARTINGEGDANISGLATGLYIAVFRLADGSSTVRKFVKE